MNFLSEMISKFGKPNESIFSDDYISLVQKFISDSESRHTAKFKIIISQSFPKKIKMDENKLGLFVKDNFLKEDLWDTEENNGVLLLISISDSLGKIHFDRGLNSEALEIYFLQIVYRLEENLKLKQTRKGIINAAAEIIQILESYFPKGQILIENLAFPFTE